MPVKYTDELKTRAVDLVIRAQQDPATATGAVTRVANELGGEQRDPASVGA